MTTQPADEATTPPPPILERAVEAAIATLDAPITDADPTATALIRMQEVSIALKARLEQQRLANAQHVTARLTAHLAEVLAPVIRAERAAAVQRAAEAMPAWGNSGALEFAQDWLTARAEAERRGEPNG